MIHVCRFSRSDLVAFGSQNHDMPELPQYCLEISLNQDLQGTKPSYSHLQARSAQSSSEWSSVSMMSFSLLLTVSLSFASPGHHSSPHGALCL